MQLINRASKRLIVVSFAVYKVPNVAAGLVKAATRGVGVDLIVESVDASGGKISFDGWKALGADGVPNIRLWTWAAERRPVTASGDLAALHAKCAVSDGEHLLVQCVS